MVAMQRRRSPSLAQLRAIRPAADNSLLPVPFAESRHRWIQSVRRPSPSGRPAPSIAYSRLSPCPLPQTVIAWFIILNVIFCFIPSSIFGKPLGKVWVACVSNPWFMLPRKVRFGLGWLGLLGLVFGSAYGFPLPQVRLASWSASDPTAHTFGYALPANSGHDLRPEDHLCLWSLCPPVHLRRLLAQPQAHQVGHRHRRPDLPTGARHVRLSPTCRIFSLPL